MLISTESLKKNINDKCILKGASFTIEDTDKIALIGVNGTGKSTLLKILAGIENYDSGTIIKKNGIKIHYLPQNPEFKTDCVWDEIQLVNSKNEHPVAEFELKSNKTGYYRLSKCNVNYVRRTKKKSGSCLSAMYKL